MPETRKTKSPQGSGRRRPAIPDEAARERIRADLDTSFLVEAGAGSGKTRSLVDRMVALIASGRATIQTLAAVTFTRKAAAELRGRFQLALEQSLRPGAEKNNPLAHERLAAALRDLEQGFIGTIHSFCARLLRERPVEGGVDPEFEELDDVENAVFREECWHDFLVMARLEADEVLRDLDEAGLTPEDLKDAFETLAEYPEVAPARGCAHPPDFEAVRASLEAFLDEAGSAVPSRRPEAGWDDMQSLLRRLFGRRGRLGFSDHRLLMESVELLDRSPRAVQKCWRCKEDAKAFETSFQEFREKTVSPALKAWREFRHAKALAFLLPALKFYDSARKGKSRLNFQDQLLLAAELLRENPEVRRYFQSRYRRVLVDEFQDTDPVQAEVLFYLTGTEAAEKDWTRLIPLPGSLFLVGDPKQSIYRFRRADIDIYNIVKERIRHGGGEVLNLTANFRSLACLAAWVNPIVASAFPASATAVQASFAPLDAVRPGCDGAAAGVYKVTVPKVDRNNGGKIAEADADSIADFVAAACAGGLRLGDGAAGLRPARPEDFLVLFRYKHHMDVYARAFERAGLPFEIAGSNAFAQSEEVDEIIGLLLALRDPDNPVAVVAVLKGLFFGASDQDLLDFRSAGGRFTFAGSGSPGPADGKAGRALQTLREWRAWTAEYAPSVVIEMILERSGLVNYLVTSEMGGSRAGIVLKLVEVVRSLEIAGTTSFAAVADFLAESYGREAVEEMSLTPGRSDAVRLMNLHKAKGLEAPVVILANPLGMADREPDRHIVRAQGPDRKRGDLAGGELRQPVGFFQFRKKARWRSRLLSEPMGWDAMAAAEAEYAKAEEDRLMYVAATRAGDILVVSTYENDLGEKRAWGILDDGLGGVPELSASPLLSGASRGGAADSARPGKASIKPAEYQRARLEIMKRRGAASLARYRIETVTSLAKQDRPFPLHATAGSGMAWGSAVHSLLNTLGRLRSTMGPGGRPVPMSDGDLRLLARNALVAAGLGGEEDKLGALVRDMTGSAFWTRAMTAERRLFEVPFSITVEPGDPDYAVLTDRPGIISAGGSTPVAPAVGAPVVLTGAVDLAFLESDGWVIADYKTDRLPDAAAPGGAEARQRALDELVDYYRPQVALYGRFWEKIAGRPVKEAGLYFTSAGRWVRIL